MIVLRPLEFLNLPSKDAVDTMCFVCFAIVFRLSGTILHNIFNVALFTDRRKLGDKTPETCWARYDDGLHSYHECCTIAVLFFVFGEVMLSIVGAISPPLYVAIDNRAS